MGKKKVTPEQAEDIEISIAEQVVLGNADRALELANSIGRKLTLSEVDSVLMHYLSMPCPELHLEKMSDIVIYGATMAMFEEVIDLAATRGCLGTMYKMSASWGRLAVQSEIDLLYLNALKDVSPIDFASSVKNYLFFNTTKSFSFQTEPSKGVAERVLRRLIDDNQLDIAESLVWLLYLHKKEQVCQELIDELVPIMYEAHKGWSFFDISNTKDVIHLSSVSVIEKLLDDFLTKSHEELRLFEFAACDKSGELTDKVVKTLIEDARAIPDVFKRQSLIRSIVQILLNSVYKVTTTVETASLIALFSLEEGLCNPAYNLSVFFTFKKEVADRITMALIDAKPEKDTDECILAMYRKYGADDEVRDLLVKSFSNNVFYNKRQKESIDILAELGGTAVLDYLSLDLLFQVRDSFAIEVAKNKLVSVAVREKVIERAIVSFSSLDFVLPLVKLNKRALKKREILSMLQLNIDALRSEEGNLDAYAVCAIELLRYKAGLELASDLLFVFKERSLTSYYVNASLITGVKIV